MKLLGYSVLLIFLMFGSGCKNKNIDNTGLAARVGENVLTMDEVLRNIPATSTGADSIRILKLFVNNWIEDQVTMLMAEKMIPDTKEIDKMVDDYRRQLLMWEYRRQMTLQNGSPIPEDADIEEYYNNHKTTLRLQRPIVKGLYIKVPENLKELPEIKRLYRSTKTADMDKLEKLAGKAVNYDYFRDTWVDWSQLESRIPAKELDTDPDRFPATNNHLEVTADGYVYLLDISDNLKAGDIMPLDYARTYIIEALERENAVSYDKTLRKQLFDKAFREGYAEMFI